MFRAEETRCEEDQGVQTVMAGMAIAEGGATGKLKRPEAGEVGKDAMVQALERLLKECNSPQV